MFVGLLYGIIINDFSAVLPLAIFFELFWLDLFPIGGYLPPNALFPYLMMLAICAFFSWDVAPTGISPGQLVVPLVLSLPFAYISPLLEAWLRKQRVPWNSQVIKKARAEGPMGPIAGSVIWQSIGLSVALELFLWIASTVILGGAIFLIFRWRLVPHMDIDWWPIYLVASVGGVLSLRIRRAYVFFICSMLILMGIMLYYR